MQNCTVSGMEMQGFWLHFHAIGDGLDMLEASLPTPNYYYRTNKGSYTVAWLLNGYFGTVKGRAYLNDIIGRLSLGVKISNRLNYAPKTATGRAYELKEFQNLPSLPRRKEQIPNTAKYEDAIFWAIKLETIARIRIAGGWIDYDSLKDWAFDMFITKAKDRSTLRAKVKSVWKWYDERNWQTDERNFTMSRAEAGRKAHEKLAKDTEAKVRGAITALEFLQEKITASAVAKQAGVHRHTAAKYLKEMKII